MGWRLIGAKLVIDFPWDEGTRNPCSLGNPSPFGNRGAVLSNSTESSEEMGIGLKILRVPCVQD